MRCSFNLSVFWSPTPFSPQVDTGAWRKKKKINQSLSSFSQTISKLTVFGVAKHVCLRPAFAFLARNPADVCGNILCIRDAKYCATIVLVLKHSVTYN